MKKLLGVAVSSAADATPRAYVDGSAYNATDYLSKGWTCDPQLTTPILLATGRVWTTRAKILEAGTVGNVLMWVTTVAATLSDARVGIYALDGTQLAISANVATTFTTGTGQKTIAMAASTPALAVDQDVVIALLTVGTTGPTIAVTTAALAANIGLTNGASTPLRQAFSSATGLTALPSPMVHTGYQAGGNGILALLRT